MPYLAVDQSGDEYIFQNKPERKSKGWTSFDFGFVKIPKGSILRLSGKLLRYENEPVELKIAISSELKIKVCAASGCDIDDLTVKTRKKEVVNARQILMAHSRIYGKLSLSEAAAEFGKDHATCSHSIHKIQELFLDKKYREQFIEIFYEFPKLLTYKIGMNK